MIYPILDSIFVTRDPFKKKLTLSSTGAHKDHYVVAAHCRIDNFFLVLAEGLDAEGMAEMMIHLPRPGKVFPCQTVHIRRITILSGRSIRMR